MKSEIFSTGDGYLNKTLDYYMSLNYRKTVIAHDDIQMYQIIYPELPGCIGWAKYEEDIEVKSKEILKLWIMCAIADNYKIPRP